jgi:hypothetical protein
MFAILSYSFVCHSHSAEERKKRGRNIYDYEKLLPFNWIYNSSSRRRQDVSRWWWWESEKKALTLTRELCSWKSFLFSLFLRFHLFIHTHKFGFLFLSFRSSSSRLHLSRFLHASSLPPLTLLTDVIIWKWLDKFLLFWLEVKMKNFPFDSSKKFKVKCDIFIARFLKSKQHVMTFFYPFEFENFKIYSHRFHSSHHSLST